jgi:hypothetical protein
MPGGWPKRLDVELVLRLRSYIERWRSNKVWCFGCCRRSRSEELFMGDIGVGPLHLPPNCQNEFCQFCHARTLN